MPSNITGIKANLNRDQLPFDDCFFDFVSATEVIEHLWNTDQFIKECYRVLKPRGYFLISTPNLASWINGFYCLQVFSPLH
ncbi:MAG: class I SAM-dependent methyltransferase [Candidatus Bathyarchaeia archaeon]